MRQIPNLLTLSRIALLPVIFVLFFAPIPGARWMALAIYCLASITDFFDGFLARKYNVQSSFGAMLDPIADKLIIATILLLVVADGTLPSVHLPAIVIILCRELLVSGMREYLAQLRISLPVSKLAKIKTAFQLIAIGFLVLGPSGDIIFRHTVFFGSILLWGAAILTLITGYDYWRVAWREQEKSKGQKK